MILDVHHAKYAVARLVNDCNIWYNKLLKYPKFFHLYYTFSIYNCQWIILLY